jgi:hypothetical protein
VGCGVVDWIELAQDSDRVLVVKPQGKRPLWSPRRGWEDNIKMDLQEVRCRGMH